MRGSQRAPRSQTVRAPQLPPLYSAESLCADSSTAGQPPGRGGGCVTIPEAMEDPKLFADWFKPAESWATWRAVLRAIFGLPMSAGDLEVFKRLTGRSRAPSQAAREAWLAVGRRGGKSRIA